VEAVRIARNCRRIIFQNFYGTLIVDTIGIGLAAAGLLNPLLATFIHVASELLFILNSTRLLPPREKRKDSIPQSPTSTFVRATLSRVRKGLSVMRLRGLRCDRAQNS
jgi:hypothetical protein